MDSVKRGEVGENERVADVGGTGTRRASPPSLALTLPDPLAVGGAGGHVRLVSPVSSRMVERSVRLGGERVRR
jgi:hypothetical protein